MGDKAGTVLELIYYLNHQIKGGRIKRQVDFNTGFKEFYEELHTADS